ncbi:hypothetical protein IHN32_07940 [Deinococcus sp. 14RED07]|uniref:hypothetical protein n=1 Tax=unclassified Deinococcus TaxID=2623546 RepID=UPI001E2E56D4|nr:MULTISPECIES: hypothetical protein [unclassified Deinococcus]MCD0158318.1 hypothetical protein [Deinococcus sp. 6GRE01]MCD0175873.1 hypothetical protein [Deinococcus sp. 14RED07]
MKQTLKVELDAIKHERDKDGELFTTLHLELPGEGLNLQHLRRAHRISTKKESREIATFTLQIYGGGDRRTWNCKSKGSKTTDFKVVAVVELPFNAAARFEGYLNALPGTYDIEFTVEIEGGSNTPLFPKNNDDRDEGINA